MTDGTPTPPRFQKAGALVAGAFYLEREADRQLVEALLAGQPCHVLASRQVGKSSLKARAILTLREKGRRVASADLSALGTESVTEDAWCYSLARTLFKSARSSLDLSMLWDGAPRETVAARLDAALRALAKEDPTRPLAVFLDEIDLLIALPFRTNVLQVLRALLNDRAEDAALAGFTLCLLGVALAVDVAPDLNHSPFIGRAIELRDFTRAELHPMAVGLRGLRQTPTNTMDDAPSERATFYDAMKSDYRVDADLLLDAVFAWTNGHPAMTQHLCADLVLQGERSEMPYARVDALVKRVFLDGGRHQDQILVDIERRFTERSERALKVLSRYHAVLVDSVGDQPGDEVQQALVLSGLVRVDDGRLVTRNRIIATAFGRAWVETRLGDRRVTRALESWLDRGRSNAALLRAELLQDALAWAQTQRALTEEERAFLDASRAVELAEAERATKQQRVVFMLLMTIVAVLAGGVGAASWGMWRARSEAARAEDLHAGEQLQRALLFAQQPEHPIDAARLVVDVVAARRDRGLADRETSFELAGRLMAEPTPWLLLTVLRRGSEGFLSATFSPDGKRVVSSVYERVARVWDATSGRVLLTLEGHSARIWRAEFSPDGSRVVTSSADGTARVWDAVSGRHVATLRGEGRDVRWAVFSPDGACVVATSTGGTAQVWEVASGRQLAVLQTHASTINGVAFPSSGARVAAKTEEGAVRVWDVTTGAVLATLRPPAEAVAKAGLSVDGERVVTVSVSGVAQVWDVNTGLCLITLQGQMSTPQDAAFSRNGARVVAYTESGSVLVWEVASGRALSVPQSHWAGVREASLSSEGNRFVAVDQDGAARVWDATPGRGVITRRELAPTVWGAAFSPDGGRVVSVDHAGTAHVWEADSGREIVTLRGPAEGMNSAEFSQDGHRVVSAANDGTTRVWDAASGRELVVFRQARTVNHAAFSPDGARVVSAGDDDVHVWDAVSGREIIALRGPGGLVWRAIYSPDGTRVITASEDGVVRVWDTASGRLLSDLPCHARSCKGVALAPDGARVVAACGDWTARVWDLRTGRLLLAFRGHTSNLNSAAFSPDGTRVITASHDGTARIWDAASGHSLATLRGHAAAVMSASFSPDGTRILTASLDGTVRIWPATLDTVLRDLCGSILLLDASAYPADSIAHPWCRRYLGLPPSSSAVLPPIPAPRPPSPPAPIAPAAPAPH